MAGPGIDDIPRFFDSAIRGIAETLQILHEEATKGPYKTVNGVTYDTRTGKPVHTEGGPVLLGPVGQPYTSPYAYKPEGTTGVYRLPYTNPNRYGPADLLGGGPVVPIQRPNVDSRLYGVRGYASIARESVTATESTQLKNYNVSRISDPATRTRSNILTYHARGTFTPKQYGGGRVPGATLGNLATTTKNTVDHKNQISRISNAAKRTHAKGSFKVSKSTSQSSPTPQAKPVHVPGKSGIK